MRFSIVCACNSTTTLLDNLRRSPNIKEHDLHIVMGHTKPCVAYNEAVKKCTEDIIIFVHQDVYLPESFFGDLEYSIHKLGDDNWGVLGVAGRFGSIYSYNVLDRGNLLRSKDKKPSIVDTLDELLLVMKKSTCEKITFDENIPNHHLFGADICLQSNQHIMWNYVIDAYCEHNSTLVSLPPDYSIAEEYIKKKWRFLLPIHTTCSIIE